MNPTTLPVRANADVIEATYRLWLDNPDSVDPTWRAFFQGFSLGSNGGPLGEAVEGHAQQAPIIDSLKQSHVHYLIAAYRAIGHLQAHLDPLSSPPAPSPSLRSPSSSSMTATSTPGLTWAPTSVAAR